MIFLQANYPRLEICEHMDRIADKYFGLEYEERKEFGPLYKLRIMEHQLRDEWSYLNKLSNLSLGYEIAPEYKIKLSDDLEELLKSTDQKPAENNTDCEKPRKGYKNKKYVAFPGKNDHILQDSVTTLDTPVTANYDSCHENKPNKKSKNPFLIIIFLKFELCTITVFVV